MSRGFETPRGPESNKQDLSSSGKRDKAMANAHRDLKGTTDRHCNGTGAPTMEISVKAEDEKSSLLPASGSHMNGKSSVVVPQCRAPQIESH